MPLLHRLALGPFVSTCFGPVDACALTGRCSHLLWLRIFGSKGEGAFLDCRKVKWVWRRPREPHIRHRKQIANIGVENLVSGTSQASQNENRCARNEVNYLFEHSLRGVAGCLCRPQCLAHSLESLRFLPQSGNFLSCVMASGI